MKYTAVIEVRMSSSRLPGKPLLTACGKTMLEHLISRLEKCINLDSIVIATTVNKTDIPIVHLAEKLGINFFRGDEHNVLKRVIGAAKSVDSDIIVEITGDCPLIDPLIVDQVISTHKNNDADYVSNANIRSYPDGMDVQVFSLKTLEESYGMTKDPLHLEHVTLHIRQNPKIFRIINIMAPSDMHYPNLGLTLDETADYNLIKIIFEHFNKFPKKISSCKNIIDFLKQNEELIHINQNVKRKGDS